MLKNLDVTARGLAISGTFFFAVFFPSWTAALLLLYAAAAIGPDGKGYSQEGWYISRVLSGEAKVCKAPAGEAVYRYFYRLPQHYKERLPYYGVRVNGLITYAIGFYRFLVFSEHVLTRYILSFYIY